MPTSQMPLGAGGMVRTRRVVLPIQPLAGSVHHGSSGLLPFCLLHLSWPGCKDSGRSASSVSRSVLFTPTSVDDPDDAPPGRLRSDEPC